MPAGENETGTEYRVAHNMRGTRRYEVCELNPEAGLTVVLPDLLEWQAKAIVAILHPPFAQD